MAALRNPNKDQREPVVLKEVLHLTNDAIELPEGPLTIHVLKGDAWVFCANRDVVVHAGETLHLDQEDHPAKLRRLYQRGMVRYTLTTD